MPDLVIAAITNFVLAGVLLFFGGMLVQRPKERFSAAWFWGWSVTLLGVGSLIGGIDHGFFEAPGLPRYGIQRSNWIELGAATFFILMTVATQFFSPRVQRGFLVFGIAQFALNTLCALLIDDYLVVILNYAPVMILMLVLSIRGLRDGTGSPVMVSGLLIVAAASVIQSTGFDLGSLLDQTSLYHLTSTVGAVFLYGGGLHLRHAR